MDTSKVNTALLRQNKDQLTADVLTDDELATALENAGLHEPARVVARPAADKG
jgi:hypothetical protein